MSSPNLSILLLFIRFLSLGELTCGSVSGFDIKFSIVRGEVGQSEHKKKHRVVNERRAKKNNVQLIEWDPELSDSNFAWRFVCRAGQLNNGP